MSISVDIFNYLKKGEICMYQYSIIDIEDDELTFTFDTYEELLAHYAEILPYTQGCDPYYRVVGYISERNCLVR